MSDRTAVDISLLTNGGINLTQWSLLANQIVNQMRTATETYRYSGGTGEMGEQFDQNYKPGEAKALAFLMMLEKAIGGQSDRTLLVAQNFSNTNQDANGATPHE